MTRSFVPVNGDLEPDEWVVVREGPVLLPTPDGPIDVNVRIERRIVRKVVGYEQRIVQVIDYDRG